MPCGSISASPSICKPPQMPSTAPPSAARAGSQLWAGAMAGPNPRRKARRRERKVIGCMAVPCPHERRVFQRTRPMPWPLRGQLKAAEFSARWSKYRHAFRAVNAPPTSRRKWQAKLYGKPFPVFSQRFSKVKKSNLTSDYRRWTFYSYLKRSAEAFGLKGDRILRQSRSFDDFMRERVRAAIVSGITKRKPVIPASLPGSL